MVVRRCVCSRNLVNEEAMAHWGLSRQNQTRKQANFKWEEKQVDGFEVVVSAFVAAAACH